MILKTEPSDSVEGDTVTKSIVAHVPVNLPGVEVSVHFNDSENFAPTGVRRNARNEILAPPTGTSRDYGITFEFFERRLSATLNWFKMTSEFVDASGDVGNAADGGVGYVAGSLGGFWYTQGFLTDTTPESPEEWIIQDDLFPTYDSIWAAIQGIIPPDLRGVYNAGPSQGGWEWESVRNGVATKSFESTGFEFELAGQLSENWNVFFNASRQETIQSNVAPVAAALAEELFARGIASGFFDEVQSPSINSPLLIKDQFRTTRITPLAAAQTKEGTVSQEQRKWRMNLITTYKFSEDTRLKGIGVGAGLRWQDKVATGYPLLPGPDGIQLPDLANPFWGPEEFNGDLWINYSRPIWKDRLGWKIQLNARNILGDHKRIPVVTNPDGRLVITRNPNPQEIFLSNTISF